MPTNDYHGVFIIYTGGTIGSLPKDRDDPLSPLVPADLGEIIGRLPNYNERDSKILLGGQWVRLGKFSWAEPLDSSNITLKDWQEMARKVKDNYDEFEGFVILHGTDTLAYTASALAFMLENLSKPVVVTGSQLPIGVTRSDAVQNLVTSIEIAAAKSLGVPVIPEVSVFFRDELYRGCRTTKLSASSFNAFYSPNYAPLAKAGEHIVLAPRRSTDLTPQLLRVVDTLDANVASMDIFPGMNTQLLKNLLATEGLRGVVLQTFGTGNAPTTSDFLDTIEQAVESGKLIVDVTQCRSGEVELGLYDVSAGLLARGVVSGMDMTIEATLTKMFLVLGAEGDVDLAADRMQMNLKGEQRQSIYNLHFPAGEIGEDEKPISVHQKRPMLEGLERYKPKTLDRALFRLMGLETLDGKKGRIEFKAYLNLAEASESTSEEGNPRFLGKASKRYQGDDENVFFTVSDQVSKVVDNRHPNVVTIVPIGMPFKWKKLNIAFYCNDGDPAIDPNE
jgi:L-asparaginase